MDIKGVSLSTFRKFLIMPKWRTVQHPVIPVPEWTKMPMPEPVCSKIKAISVPGLQYVHWDAGFRNADAGDIDLDAGAQLCQLLTVLCSLHWYPPYSFPAFLSQLWQLSTYKCHLWSTESLLQNKSYVFFRKKASDVIFRTEVSTPAGCKCKDDMFLKRQLRTLVQCAAGSSCGIASGIRSGSHSTGEGQRYKKATLLAIFSPKFKDPI